MNDDLHTLVGAYALNALPAEERADFEWHMARCDACSEEVRGLLDTTARLGSAVTLAPPARLRAQVLDQIGTVRQLPPQVAEVRSLRRVWVPRLTAGLAAACLVAAIVTGGLAIRTQQRLERAEAAGKAVATVLAAPDARTVTSRIGTGGNATVVASAQQGKIVFASAGMARLPASKTYQLWFMSPSAVRPAGLVGQDARPVVAGSIGDANRVGITVEPAGGSPQPTTIPVAVLPIA